MATGADKAQGYTYDTIRITAFGFEMPVAQADGTTLQYFPIRHICRWLGIDHTTQYVVLRLDSVFKDALLEDLPYKTETRGWRPAMWIRRDKFARWLLDIDAKKCELRSRYTLMEWQDAILKAADTLLFGASPAVPLAERGTAHSTIHAETHMHCLDCGAPHQVIIEGERTTVLRVRSED